MSKPNKAGFDPRWTTEENIARFSFPFFDFEPIKFAGFIPVTELIKFNLHILSAFLI